MILYTMIKQKEISIETKKKFEIIDITTIIKKEISGIKIKEGIVSIMTKHTTTAITLNENETLLLKDIEEYLKRVTENKKEYHHDKISERRNCPVDEPKNAAAHLQSIIIGSSETIPIKNNELILGTWQKILFLELDGPRKRDIFVTIIGD